MSTNPRLRAWLRAGGLHDDRALDAQQVALFIADGGFSKPGDNDTTIIQVIRLDDQLGDGMVELREDHRYYISSRTATRVAESLRVTVIDGGTGECLAQGWLEPETAAAPDPGAPAIQPFVAARPSGLSDDGIGMD